jgi:hypothetical protein
VKKILVVLLIVLMPVMAFADFQLGATALYTGDITRIDRHQPSVSDFLFGLDARAKLWIFQLGTTPLYLPDQSSFYVMNDLGLSLDIWFLRVGAGIGPNFLFSMGGEDETMLTDWNLRATTEIKLGSFSIGVAAWYLMSSPSDLKYFRDIIKDPPFVSITALIKLF